MLALHFFKNHCLSIVLTLKRSFCETLDKDEVVLIKGILTA